MISIALSAKLLSDKDFRTAVVPAAKRLEEGFTRRILHDKLHWYDLEFKYVNLDDPDLETMLDMETRLYSMNAETPNGARKALGRAPLDSPLADLTQQESMLMMIQAQNVAQNQMADQSMQRQQSMMEQMGPQPGQQQPGQQQPGQQQQPGAPAPQKMLPAAKPDANAKNNGQIPNPKPLSLPKFPIQGTIYTAKQVAMMPVNQMQDVLSTSRLRPSSFIKAMDEQEPGILQQLSDEVKEFIQQRLDEEQNSGSSKIKPRQWKKWEKELRQARKRDNRRTNDLSEWMRTKGGTSLGRPGTSSGRPGTSRPTRS